MKLVRDKFEKSLQKHEKRIKSLSNTLHKDCTADLDAEVEFYLHLEFTNMLASLTNALFVLSIKMKKR